jgi:hypothetical protein
VPFIWDEDHDDAGVSLVVSILPRLEEWHPASPLTDVVLHGLSQLFHGLQLEFAECQAEGTFKCEQVFLSLGSTATNKQGAYTYGSLLALWTAAGSAKTLLDIKTQFHKNKVTLAILMHRKGGLGKETDGVWPTWTGTLRLSASHHF